MTTEAANFTIAIPTYNRADTVSRRVEEFLALKLPSDVRLLVVDNHSPDGTYDRLMSRFDNGSVRILTNERNLGFAGNFFRLIEEADSEYVIILSDEDRLHAEGFGALMEFCRRVSPNMVSPRAQAGQNPLYRGRAVTREIGPAEFESASFYLSGVTYASRAAKEVATVVSALVPDNSAATVYPQVLVTALLVARGDSYFLDALVSSQAEVRETMITDTSGAKYNGVEGRWAQFTSFEDFFAMDHSAIVGRSGVPRLEAMRAQTRKGVLGLLIDAAIREAPALGPYLRRPVKRSLGGRIVDVLRRFRRT